MSETPPKDIETKIIEFLGRVGAPNVPSQIACYIHEPREETNRAIERLVKQGRLYSVSDFTFLNSTRETTAYGLA